MQNHAPYGCMTFFGKIAESSGIFLRATVRPVPHVGGCKSGSVPGEFLAIIIPRSRIRPESDGR